MSKVLTGRVDEETHHAFMMIAAERREQASKLIKGMVERFIIENGENIPEIKVYREYKKRKFQEMRVWRVEYLIKAYRVYPPTEDKWQELRDECKEIGVNFEELKGKYHG